MTKPISVTIITTFLAFIFFGAINSSNAGLAGFLIGPDGDAYNLVDCSIPENNANPDLCANTSIGEISWDSSRERAVNMTFKGFPCDLGAPSTKEINDFLKSFPGFLEACNSVTCSSGVALCAWFGGLKVPPSPNNGPFQFVNDPNNIPCPFNSDNGPACNPIVNSILDTPLAFQDWCRNTEQNPNCNGVEPNGQDFMTYLSLFGVIGWADCTNFNCANSRTCEPTSYFVQCYLPLQTIVLSPDSATNDVLTQHTVTSTVEADGVAEPDVLVNYEVISGPNAGEMSDPNSGECTPRDDCTTDANGEVSWTYTGSKTPGTDTIIASFFDENIEEVIESNSVMKTWVIPPRNVPTLSEWGLISMAGILGVVGFMVMRRRKATA